MKSSRDSVGWGSVLAAQDIHQHFGAHLHVPIRGGTDGARLSYMGLPCPNLCTGGENFHGRFEYIPVEDMQMCADMLYEIIRNPLAE